MLAMVEPNGVGATMDQVEVEGLRIAYERVGVGPPLVLVHGFVGDGRSTWVPPAR
jgi:pimeloyl-ACP methyl ester carboxylesterase